MSPALNGSSALERFERGNEIEILNGIMFNFYPGLSHLLGKNNEHWFTINYLLFPHVINHSEIISVAPPG